jgi:hypothetical protein
VPSRLNKWLRELKIIGLPREIRSLDLDQSRVARQLALDRDHQRAEVHVPVLTRRMDPFGCLAGQTGHGAKVPGRLRGKKHDPIRIDREHDVTASGPGLLQVFEADFEGGDSDQLAVFPKRAREVEARQSTGRANPIETAFAALDRIPEVRTVRQVHSDEARLLIPVAGRDRDSLAVQNVQRGGSCDSIDLLQSLVHDMEQIGVARIAQYREHVAFEREQAGQVLVLGELAPQRRGIDLEPMCPGFAQTLAADPGGDPIGEEDNEDDGRGEADPEPERSRLAGKQSGRLRPPARTADRRFEA